MSGAATHPRAIILKNPTNTHAAGAVLPAGVPTVALAWKGNDPHAWQMRFALCVRNTGANPITQIIVQRSEVLAGTNPANILDANALPAGEERWYTIDPTPPFVQIQATSALGSTCDILGSETYAIA